MLDRLHDTILAAGGDLLERVVKLRHSPAEVFAHCLGSGRFAQLHHFNSVEEGKPRDFVLPTKSHVEWFKTPGQAHVRLPRLAVAHLEVSELAGAKIVRFRVSLRNDQLSEAICGKVNDEAVHVRVVITDDKLRHAETVGDHPIQIHRGREYVLLASEKVDVLLAIAVKIGPANLMRWIVPMLQVDPKNRTRRGARGGKAVTIGPPRRLTVMEAME